MPGERVRVDQGPVPGTERLRRRFFPAFSEMYEVDPAYCLPLPVYDAVLADPRFRSTSIEAVHRRRPARCRGYDRNFGAFMRDPQAVRRIAR